MVYENSLIEDEKIKLLVVSWMYKFTHFLQLEKNESKSASHFKLNETWLEDENCMKRKGLVKT